MDKLKPEQVRHEADWGGMLPHKIQQMLYDAADALEQQAAHIAELEAENARYKEALDGIREYVDENEFIFVQEQRFILRVVDKSLKGDSNQ